MADESRSDGNAAFGSGVIVGVGIVIGIERGKGYSGRLSDDACSFADYPAQMREVDGFDEVVVATVADRGDGVFGIAVGTEHDNDELMLDGLKRGDAGEPISVFIPRVGVNDENLGP